MLIKIMICLLISGSAKIYSFGSNYGSDSHQYYEFDEEFSAKVSHIYNQYLSTEKEGPKCDPKNEFSGSIAENELTGSCQKADQQIQEFIANDKNYLAKDPRGLNFSEYVYKVGLSATYNQFVTKNIVIDQCLNKLETAMKLPKIELPKCIRSPYCDVESEVSSSINCDPNYKYRRIDGKCNNLVNTNWGSNFHCQNRLLPPDYKDGVSEPRAAVDGSPLPNSRLITTKFMSDKKEIDLSRTSMHMVWGQFITHDSFKTLQYWSLAIKCCANPSVHRECFPITDIPSDKFSKAYNQSCINFVRSIGCNTCSLGPREQINAVTTVLDLSHIYGSNENISLSLRTFRKGELRTIKALDGSNILPEAVPYVYDLDKIDLTPCNPLLEKPWLKCFKTGDTIRGNQNPMATALNVIFVERHNQHCRGLAKVNPHWNDEKLYQEAKRLLTAEYQMINSNEFIPTILNKQQIDFYQLPVQKSGYTEYNPKANPSVFQSVGVAALRYGHSQVTSNYKVTQKHFWNTYSLTLRHKFFEVSDIWEGNSGPILEGTCQLPTGRVDPNINEDVLDFLFLNKCNPQIIDLAAININRGRDHGVPAYIYYLEYCSGVTIKSWTDLYKFICKENVDKMRAIYDDYRDIDLYVGGLAETHLPHSPLGLTFGCLLGIQFYHWKFGDRFYFEHSGQSGSFTPKQLENIREVAWMSKMLCATTNISALQTNAFLMPSKSNKIMPCNKMNEFDYSLWRESSP